MPMVLGKKCHVKEKDAHTRVFLSTNAPVPFIIPNVLFAALSPLSVNVS